MKLNVIKGQTSKLVQVFIQDSNSSVGAGLTGLVFNSASLSAYYYREGAATATAITLATMTLGTWATGGFVVVDGTNLPGLYQLGIPDAALASGANSVVIMLKGATNMAPVLLEIQLVSFDPNDSVRMGLTALPNAAAGANGGLPTGNASGQVAVGSTASGAITSASFAANALDAVWSTATRVLTAATNLTTALATPTNITAGTITNLTNAPTSGDFTATMKTSLNAATPVVTVSDKTGFSLSAAGIQAIWDALTSALTTVGSVGKAIADNLTGNAFTRLGAPAGASISADIAAVAAKTTNLPSDPADASDIAASFSAVNTTLSTIAGYVDTEVAAIKAKTDLIPASPAAVGDIPTATQNADALLNRDMSAVSDTNSRTLLQAIRFLRNRWTASLGLLSVYKEDDATLAWSADIATDDTAQPITGTNPR